jgi:hypothetical protein
MYIKQAILEKIKLSHLVIALPLAGFLLPFLVPGPQWLTGTLVNCFFFLFAFKLPRQNILPISIFPSLGALARGFLFGKATLFLFFFLPFIWIGNLILIKSFLSFKKTTPLPVAISLSSLFKSASLYLPALLYVHSHVVPALFLQSMGIIQFFTAILGAITAVAILKSTKINYES